ncbi:unnamed protein product [Leptidea sinapis]|uniref:MADF domain-containing protein n=1 Tax=Leptidea sinapis TaxID=189913 RepID=A0A5E4Q2T5_9NEOP|nr:unnamed protein product [Leptidea sinapis]
MALCCSTPALIVETSIGNLIEEVEKRPALYKKKSLKEYSDANLKKKLWEEVCEIVIPDWNTLSSEDKTKQDILNMCESEADQYEPTSINTNL